MKIVFATSNANKLVEIKEILSGSDIEIVSVKDMGISMDGVVEDGTSFEENAIIKAKYISQKANVIAMADDSGLEVDYINKEPGVYSARYMGEDTSYDIKNKAIIDRLENAKGSERSARFRCAIATVFPDGKTLVSDGSIEGEIPYEPKGDNGFGYDPIMYIPELGKTTAELSSEEKNAISHRGKALRKMRDMLLG